MREVYGFFGFWIGMSLGIFLDAPFLVAILSCLIGIVWGNSIDKEKEKEESENRAEKEKEELKSLEIRRRNQAVTLAKNYPEATKYFFKQHWGIVKSCINDYDITSDKIDLLLSHSEFEYSLKEEDIKSARREAERKAAEQKRLEAERWEEQKRLQEEQEREERERQERERQEREKQKRLEAERLKKYAEEQKRLEAERKRQEEKEKRERDRQKRLEAKLLREYGEKQKRLQEEQGNVEEGKKDSINIREWIQKQNEYLEECKLIKKRCLSNWNSTIHNLLYQYESIYGTACDNYKIYQCFYESYCSDDNLNYEYTPLQKEVFEKKIPDLKSLSVSYKTSLYDRILNYIISLKNTYGDVLVVLGDSKEKVEFNKFHFNYFIKQLNDKSISYLNTVKRIKSLDEKWKYIVFVEIVSTNDNVKKQVEKIIQKHEGKAPYIVFISLVKEYNTEEMKSIINERIKQIEKDKQKQLKQERERQEQERLRQERERLKQERERRKLERQERERQERERQERERQERERQERERQERERQERERQERERQERERQERERQERERQERERQERERQERERQERERQERERQERYKNTLLEKVSGWDSLGGGLKYFSMYYYYPTTCEFDVDDEDWNIRWLIWNFKASPKDGNVNYAKKEGANEKVREELSKCLRNSFSSENLSNITFVCIPASSSVSTERRYKDFSESICNELGMKNAYQYINVCHDGEQKHNGGVKKAEYSFDSSFFKGKYVVLFDDVITQGDSMIRFKRKMEQMGAVVICGISIGRTTHTPHDIHPIDMI